ncbi:hypothetical protein FCR2A7T_19250 [Flavobacterium cauense R2A-7]|nr:hypothetical protein FCR2A7T_19250 [Flavobacterium cauense R2A-7]
MYFLNRNHLIFFMLDLTIEAVMDLTKNSNFAKILKTDLN